MLPIPFNWLNELSVETITYLYIYNVLKFGGYAFHQLTPWKVSIWLTNFIQERILNKSWKKFF